MTRALTYGGTPVPWTVSWTDEDRISIGRCPFSGGRKALVQPSSPGVGKPLFGKPHANRQRECIARDLCDLCAKPLTLRTKVSLSHARPQPHGAEGWAVLQVEPMLHKECARISMRFCPALRRDIREGTLRVRQVLRYRVQFAIMDEVYCESVAGEATRAVGHAKVELIKWVDRDEAWLCGTTPHPIRRAGESGRGRWEDGEK